MGNSLYEELIWNLQKSWQHTKGMTHRKFSVCLLKWRKRKYYHTVLKYGTIQVWKSSILCKQESIILMAIYLSMSYHFWWNVSLLRTSVIKKMRKTECSVSLSRPWIWKFLTMLMIRADPVFVTDWIQCTHHHKRLPCFQTTILINLLVYF